MGSSSDLSSYYALEASQWDGSTVVNTIPWGANTPDVYRQAAIADAGAVGRIPVNAFTRSAAEPGSTATPIANTGAIVVARFPKASSSARIGIIPRDSTVITQLQTLAPDPTARLWAMPGDSIYIVDPGVDPAGGRSRVDFYVKPINFFELDALLKLPPLPAIPSEPPVFALTTLTDPTIPYTRAPRVVYFLTPPVADYQYTLIPPETVPVGYELVFVGTNNRPFILDANEINGGTDITNNYYVPGRGVVTMISGGGFYAPIGSASNIAAAITTGQVLNPWRGVRRANFSVALAEAFALPNAANLPSDAVLYAVNGGAGTVTLTGTVNGAANLVLTAGQAAVLVPYGTTWIGVKT